ncbi:hypothetical protein [Streptomyces sp. NPDC002573]|uniref:hypothetical protein n=1 Tax=Streptomyces sp. NPDC002573 TaxID=3364651 RepID=UPI0036A8AC73
MRTVPHPRTGEGAAILGVLTLVVLETVAVNTAPTRDKPMVGGALMGAATAAFILIAALWHHHRQAEQRTRKIVPEDLGEEWFTAKSLEGFPMEAVRPFLLGPNAPSLNRLYTAWLLATHGHDPAWIAHHIDLPPDVVHLLADAARQRN